MLRMGYAGLLRIDLPGAVIVRLSDGAQIKWGADVFVPRHATYGSIGAVHSLAEGTGNEVPALQIELNPPTTASAAALVQPGAQKSRVQCWIAEVDLSTALVVGTPPRLFDGFLDQAKLVRGAQNFSLEISVVSALEQLFELNIGNGLNPSFHKSVWPGETGEDQATGLVLQDAWGVEAPPSSGGVTSTGVGGIFGTIYAIGKVMSA